jgi:hypothetical protein
MNKNLDQDQMQSELNRLQLRGRYLASEVAHQTGVNISEPPMAKDDLLASVRLMEQFCTDLEQKLAASPKKAVESDPGNSNVSALTTEELGYLNIPERAQLVGGFMDVASAKQIIAGRKAVCAVKGFNLTEACTAGGKRTTPTYLPTLNNARNLTEQCLAANKDRKT